MSQVPVADRELSAALQLYDKGHFDEALAAFRSPAERGLAEAQYMIGLMHHRGRGTPIDPQKALIWYEKAAAQHYAAALANLGVLWRDGAKGGEAALERDIEAARKYLRRAAYLGNVPGQVAFAALLLNERRSPEEVIEGLAFMRIAAESGDAIAKDNLAKLEVTDEEARAVTRKQAAIAASIDSGVVKPRVSETKRVVSAGRPAGDKILLRHVAVRDPMIHDCVAMTMLVPKDWRFEGRMDWCLDESVLVNPAWRITDAAQGFSMASLPFRHFTWSEGNVMPIGSRHLGMIVLPRIYDPADFVRRFWGKTLAKAVEHPPVRVRELPALAAQAAREWGAPADARGFALRYAWNEGGRDVEQEVIFALVYPRGTTTWFVTHCYTVEGRKGLIDERAGLTASTYASGEYTSEWKAGWRITYQLFLRRANAEIVEARKLAAALNEHRDEMAKIAAEMERDRAASNAARHRALSEALGGIETWTDPWQGRRIELPQGYKEAWVNQDGDVLLSDRSGFDPNASDTRVEGTWKPSQKIDPMQGR